MLSLPPPRSPASVLIPLDGTPARAAGWVKQLAPLGLGFKIGLELFYRLEGGPDELGLKPGGFFLDLKLHDIPNTVAGGLAALARWRPFLINIHCSAGPEAMRAAAAAVAKMDDRPALIGVTVLTSLSAADTAALGFADPPGPLALRLARLAKECGLDGVVCSGEEIAAIKTACGPAFLAVVPGIRPAGSGAGDQKRVVTPAEAFRRGADFIVIGRPITGAPDPVAAAQAVLDEIK